MNLRGHPGATRMIQADLAQGVFTRVNEQISIYQDSGHAVRATVQLTNTCNHIRRADAPGCALPIDHPGGYHANALGQIWKIHPAATMNTDTWDRARELAAGCHCGDPELHFTLAQDLIRREGA